MNHEWRPIYNWLFLCDGETLTYIFNQPSSLMASWNGSDFPLSEFLFCRGMSMADKNISQGSRNAELTKKMAAWWTQPESGMNVQEEAGKGLVTKARQGQGHVLWGPWKTVKLRQLSSCMQDISSLAYTTQPKLGSAYFSLFCTFQIWDIFSNNKNALFKVSKSHIPHGFQYTFQLVNKMIASLHQERCSKWP